MARKGRDENMIDLMKPKKEPLSVAAERLFKMITWNKAPGETITLRFEEDHRKEEGMRT